MTGLRLLVYDATCAGRFGLPGLSAAWRAGGLLYGALGALDARAAVSSWPAAFAWLLAQGERAPIAEVQFWGHGSWGRAYVAGESLDAGALEPGHPWHPALAALRARLLPGGTALWWFRTCETFGTEAGHAFARAWTRFFGCRAAGHTYVIGPWQSGLHCLSPGQEPDWPASEGVPARARVGPHRALRSRPGAPRTIS